MDADVNVFDLAAVHERATWEQPAQESEGMDAVFVGGAPAILHGAFTGAANGQVLWRKNPWTIAGLYGKNKK